MERRDFLKIALAATAGAATLAVSAQAAPLAPQPLTNDGRLPAIKTRIPLLPIKARSIASSLKRFAGAVIGTGDGIATAGIAAGAAATGKARQRPVAAQFASSDFRNCKHTEERNVHEDICCISAGDRAQSCRGLYVPCHAVGSAQPVAGRIRQHHPRRGWLRSWLAPRSLWRMPSALTIARLAGIPARSASAASGTAGKSFLGRGSSGDPPCFNLRNRQTKPRVSGVLPWLSVSCSDRAATSVTPHETIGTDTAARHHDHRGPFDHDDAAIGDASAIGTAMESRAASAGGVRGAEARDGACQQNCCEKVFHVFSFIFGPHRATPQSLRVS